MELVLKTVEGLPPKWRNLISYETRFIVFQDDIPKFEISNGHVYHCKPFNSDMIPRPLTEKPICLDEITKTIREYLTTIREIQDKLGLKRY